GEAGKIEQDEGELESAPARRLDGEPLAERPYDGAIRHPEGVEGVTVLGEHADASLDPVSGETREAQQLRGRLAARSLKSRDARSPRLDPAAVLRHERPQRSLGRGAIRERPERFHREL